MVRGSNKEREVKSSFDIDNLGEGDNKLTLIEGLSNELGIHSYVTHCKN